MRHAFFSGLEPTLHIAHRGGAALAPENTMAAFRQAVERYGTDMLEIDVHLTADGVVVVHHDDDLDRCTSATGPLAARTWADLQQIDAGHRFTADGGVSFPWRDRGVTVPALSEVLEVFPTLRLNIEIKPVCQATVRAFVAVIRDHGALDRVCMGSASDTVAAWLAEACPEGCHFYPERAMAAFIWSVQAGKLPPLDPRYTVLDMPDLFYGARLVTPRLLEMAAGSDRWVNVWTVDDPVHMDRLIRMGVGGVMTDRPDRLLAALVGA